MSSKLEMENRKPTSKIRIQIQTLLKVEMMYVR